MNIVNSINFFKKKENFFYILLCLYPWLLISGPFLSDSVAIILSINYLFEKISSRKFDDFKNFAFILFSVFCIYIFLNSIFIGQNTISIKSSAFYFRFGLFSLAVCFLLQKNKNELKYFFFSLCLVLLVLFFDAVFQKIFGVNIFGIKMHHGIRVSSFFADELILGSYVIKILPITLSFLYFIHREQGDRYSIILFLISFVIVLISAEKASFFMTIIFLLLFIPILNFSKKIKSLILFIFLLLVAAVLIINKPIQKRLYHQLISQSAGGKYIYSRVHESHFKTAFKMFIDKPLFGHGPKMYRVKCSDKKYMEDRFACSTHPHNYILQILAETGLIGIFFLFLFYISIFIIFIKNLRVIKSFKNFSYTEYILSSSLLVMFFPLATAGNIFNNWISCVNFLTIGILLYFIQSNKNRSFSQNTDK
jgi:O-antigen ligase